MDDLELDDPLWNLVDPPAAPMDGALRLHCAFFFRRQGRQALWSSWALAFVDLTQYLFEYTAEHVVTVKHYVVSLVKLMDHTGCYVALPVDSVAFWAAFYSAPLGHGWPRRAPLLP